MENYEKSRIDTEAVHYPNHQDKGFFPFLCLKKFKRLNIFFCFVKKMDMKIYSNDELNKLFSNYLYYYDLMVKQKIAIEKIKDKGSVMYSNAVAQYNKMNNEIKPFTNEIRYIFANPSKIRIVQVPLLSILREQYQVDKENLNLQNKLKNLENIFSQTIKNFRIQDVIPVEYSARELEKEISIHEKIVQDLEETFIALSNTKPKNKKKTKKKKESTIEDRIFGMIGL